MYGDGKSATPPLAGGIKRGGGALAISLFALNRNHARALSRPKVGRGHPARAQKFARYCAQHTTFTQGSAICPDKSDCPVTDSCGAYTPGKVFTVSANVSNRTGAIAAIVAQYAQGHMP